MQWKVIVAAATLVAALRAGVASHPVRAAMVSVAVPSIALPLPERLDASFIRLVQPDEAIEYRIGSCRAPHAVSMPAYVPSPETDLTMARSHRLECAYGGD